MVFDDRYADDEYEQNGADGKVPVSQNLRAAFNAPLKQWTVRILCGCAGLPPFWDTHASIPAVVVGWLSDLLQLDAAVVSDREALRHQVLDMRQHLAPQTVMATDCVARRNLRWLGASAGLDALEQQILQFAFAVRAFNSLRSACLTLPNMSRADAPHVLAAILDANPLDVQRAISLRGRLMRSGLVGTYVTIDSTIDHMAAMARSLSLRIHLHTGDPADILEGTCTRLPRPSLTLRDYPYMTVQTELAQRWLQGAIGQVGAHLLITGAPGLGKTEWVRALIAEMGLPARDLAVLNEDGDALSGEDRVKNLRLCMHLLLGREQLVMVFDEADDAFVLGEKLDNSAQSVANYRAALNRMLEESTMPVIWIMNHPEVLHPAMLRRFDAVIQFAPMPRSLRLQLLRDRFGGQHQWPKGEIERWADVPGLSAALIDRLDRVARRAEQGGVPLGLVHCRQWIHERLDDRQARALIRDRPSQTWDSALVHSSVPLDGVIESIRLGLHQGRTSGVRILLHGPSGAGKTAFARELARKLDRPLMEKRASDLLSPWVGGTEKQIDEAFEEARCQDTVLFIDEVDSFLTRRDLAQRSWEVSMVNEVLVQLADFDGVVVLATNRLDALDKAVLRRMDLKLELRTLGADQVIHALSKLTDALGLPAPDTDQQLELAGLRNLTVGDFVTLGRRLQFDPVGEDPVNALIARLREEVRLKQDPA